MSTTLADIEDRVLARLAADMATPSYSKINSNNITEFANDRLAKIVHFLASSKLVGDLQALVEMSDSIALSAAGVGALASDFEYHLAVKIDTARTRAKVYLDPDKFAKWDSSNFILTPTSRKPIALIAGGNVRVKPISSSTAYVDYAKTHPTLGAAQDTEFSAYADGLLVILVYSDCLAFLEEFELLGKAHAELKQAGMVI